MAFGGPGYFSEWEHVVSTKGLVGSWVGPVGEREGWGVVGVCVFFGGGVSGCVVVSVGGHQENSFLLIHA